MIDIQGVKIVKRNVNYIEVVERGTEYWTILVKFSNGDSIRIGNYSTKGYANDILNESIVLK